MTDPMTFESGRWLAEATANLDVYIEDRAQTKAEAALARAYLEADARVTAAHADLGERLRRELAEALDAPARTPWESLIAKARNQATKRDGAQQ